ncbi:sialate O-acetylesterase [Aliiruegeria lutimaris]|uniref:Fibronectin type III domain-containing protein n=1 Tax=Aliiruegeria lutimaris TaxID=571298 RepID=A0A1G8VWQ5_9RHOB|nr:sialate O-acetylesterase [Aliiruegeria lutimaris]SDJ70482.1 Fibronectin type III domain-containing protein [Aliiruegeria lutimaris]
MTNAISIVRPLVSGIARPMAGFETVTRVFILAGQSNMIGRADFDCGQGLPDGVMQFGMDGTLTAATIPLDHHDAITGDMGLDVQFAIDFKAAFPNEQLVFLPAAKGATGFSSGDWIVGGTLYADLVSRANALFIANPSFRLGGILWHQGEADTGYAAFKDDLDAIIDGLRGDISAANDTTPFVLGELVPDFINASTGNGALNDAIADTPNRHFHTAVASSQVPSPLDDLGDDLHFDAASLRVLGSRYFEALSVAAAHKPTVPEAVSDLAALAGNEQIGLSWTAPANGGLAVTDYVIERSLDWADWTEIADGVSASTGFTDTGLVNGTTYFYRLAAVNEVGASPYSDAVSAVPEAGAASVLTTAFAATTDDGVSHLFEDVDVGVGGTVIVAGASRNSTTDKGLSGIMIGGQAATLFERGEYLGNYLRFGYVTGVPAGLVDIELQHESWQMRAGVHVWVLKNADPAAALAALASSATASVDATAEGVVLGAGISINPASQSMEWSGIDTRLGWTNYGDNFGSGAGDRAFAADSSGHSVSFTSDGNFMQIALLSVPKA